MKQIRFIALLLCLAAGTEAHVGDRVYPVFEIPDGSAPRFSDGALTDWEGIVPDASALHSDFEASVNELDIDDLAFRVFLTWNHRDQMIYVAVERFDDIFIGFGEMMFLYVDGDHSGGQFRWSEETLPSEDERRLRNYSQAQMYAFGPSLESGKVEAFRGLMHDWTLDPRLVPVGAEILGEAPSRFTVEAGLPAWDEMSPAGAESSERSVLHPGKIIGMRLSVMDTDEPAREDGSVSPKSFHQLPGVPFPGADLGNADTMGDAELIPCDLPGCSGRFTGVHSESWGRIKASLR